MAPTTPAQLLVYIQPRASRNEIVGTHDGHVKIRLAAPPVDGAANEALIAFVAEMLNVPRCAVTLVRGATARRKVLEIEGVSAETVAAVFG